MTPEIKNRIDKIRRGEVPEGYEQTEAGIMPNDWFEYKLGDMMNIFRGASPRPKGDPRYYGGSIPRLLIEDITRDGKYPIPRIDSLTEEGAKKSRLLPKGSLVMSCSGTQVGIMGFLGVDACIHDGFFGFNSFSNVLPEYFYQYFLLYFENLQSFATQGGVFNNLTTKIMKELICCIPDMDEQQRIVEILTTHDKIIELKKKLIAEKQQQKKYLMQQLLTGKKRLPGETGTWKNEQLGKLFLNRIETRREDLQLLAITGARGVVPRSELDLKDNSSEDKSNYLRICTGDIGYNTMRMWQGVSAYSNYEGIVSPAYTILKPANSINAKYFAYLFKMTEIIFLFYRFSQGLVDDTRNLKYENFKKIWVTYPENLSEQNAIVRILETADQEITLLQQSLEQEKQKKKALMQLLLTGIVRVNV